MKTKHRPIHIDALFPGGLRAGPSQRIGKIRLVPLLRDEPIENLRMFGRDYGDDLAIARVHRASYCSYVPYGLIFEQDSSYFTVKDTNLGAADGEITHKQDFPLRIFKGMTKRESKTRFRMLPLHLAMEGFLGLHFNGPDIAWEHYTKRTLTQGLSPRVECALPGQGVFDLEAALNLFEIHENQVGVLLFVAESLASAFVTTHPKDYRRLHDTLLLDFYGTELIWHGLYGEAQDHLLKVGDRGVSTLEDLAAAVAEAQRDWSEVELCMAAPLLYQPLELKVVRWMKQYRLGRFITNLDDGPEHHMGECILDAQGRLAYLKTFRLDKPQIRRARLLKVLADHEWHPERAAASLKIDLPELNARLKSVGFDFMLRPEVVAAAKCN